MLTVVILSHSAPDSLRLRSDPSFFSSIPSSTSRSVNTQWTPQLRLDAEPCDSCRAHSRCPPVLARPGQRPPAPEQGLAQVPRGTPVALALGNRMVDSPSRDDMACG